MGLLVEATMHHAWSAKIDGKLTQTEMDDEVFTSASKIRTSAAFGEMYPHCIYPYSYFGWC